MSDYVLLEAVQIYIVLKTNKTNNTNTYYFVFNNVNSIRF